MFLPETLVPLGLPVTGYGPPRLQTPVGTQVFAEFLEKLDLEILQSKADRETMSAAGIYGLPMGRDAEAEFEIGVRREIASYFPLLRDYVVAAARCGNGLLMWLT